MRKSQRQLIFWNVQLKLKKKSYVLLLTHRITKFLSELIPSTQDRWPAGHIFILNLFVPAKIFLFLKWEIFKRSWIRLVIELITWLPKALVFLVRPPLCMYCSSFFSATAFLLSISHYPFKPCWDSASALNGLTVSWRQMNKHLQCSAWPLGCTRAGTETGHSFH